MMEVENNTFPIKLHLNSTIVAGFETTPGEEPPYVFQAKSNAQCVAASTSDNVIKIFDPNTRVLVRQLNGHTNTINEFNFASTSPEGLFSASSDGTIRRWDMRAGSAVQTIKDGNVEFYSVGVNQSDTGLASGSGNTIKAWDLRTGKVALTYEDFHSDDITQVKFHPTKSNVLYTASMDGTVCVVDTNISDEEEALLEGELNKRVFLTHTGINLEDPIQHIGFYGSQQEKIWISTHSERLSLYHESIPIHQFESPRQLLSNSSTEFNYLISCTYDAQEDELYVVVGTNEGTIGLAQVKEGGLNLVSQLSGGHNTVVRWVQWDVHSQQMISGGEDARICFWSENPEVRMKRVELRGRNDEKKQGR
ncbi:WD repeat-containing protein 89-like [Planoprotostelium fungivorum]|uniref:WD repeat-containing protein 89-like n=1 Tax=Planoprotostelium fungivorum TaxID=1890364 RepID=A0A2P6N0K6_9EUKA|nr:WD repeat-containing protein 89-like [Planoprotostelium fungivorum]